MDVGYDQIQIDRWMHAYAFFFLNSFHFSFLFKVISEQKYNRQTRLHLNCISVFLRWIYLKYPPELDSSKEAEKKKGVETGSAVAPSTQSRSNHDNSSSCYVCTPPLPFSLIINRSSQWRQTALSTRRRHFSNASCRLPFTHSTHPSTPSPAANSSAPSSSSALASLSTKAS